MSLIQTIKIEIERRTKEHNLSIMLFSILFLFAYNKGFISFLSFFLAYWSFPEEITKRKIAYLLKLPYKKTNLYTSSYIFGSILAIIPFLITMLFFDFNSQRIITFVNFYTFFFSVQTMISTLTNKGTWILLGSFAAMFLDNLISYYNIYYSVISIVSCNYWSLLYVFVLFLIGMKMFKESYEG